MEGGENNAPDNRGGRAALIVGGIVAAVALLISTTKGCADPPRKLAATAAQTASSEQVARERQVAQCKLDIDAQRTEHARLVAKREFWDATNTLRACADLLDDAEAKQMVKASEVKALLRDVRDTKNPLRVRATYAQRLVDEFPAEGKPFLGMAEKWTAQADRQEKSEQAAAKRREGVRLGMSAEDVLASSWGRPEKVNRTTATYGTREQWVYGSGNYLYFEDGVLTSIQN